ncbi:MAG: hypothetical protein C3F06_00300 [Candidatus Methanoperedenaceae archaeon]|nr:MAG: hypothetical protein C3F06_00300 [Candidatus Methanoperedenaceae archaeon]
MIKEIVGPIPRDENFYDRKDLIKDMWNITDEHDIFLIGPRRFGKSGILCRMHDIPEKGFKVIFMDCEKLEDPYEFFAELLVEVLKNKTLRLKIKDCANSIPLIPAKIIDKVKDHISEIELSEIKVAFRESIEKHWKEESIRCIKELNKLAYECNEKILFLLDEFPSLLKHMIDDGEYHETKLFLEWFRAIRLDLNLTNTRFVIAGSRNIYTVYRNIPDLLLEKGEIKNSQLTYFSLPQVFNDFRKISIEPFDAGTAKEFIKELFASNQITIEEDIPEKILNLIGSPVPYFMQLLISETKRAHGGNLTPKKIEKIYNERILGPTCRYYFDYYEDRLKEYGQINENGAKAIVTELSKAGKLTKSELFDIFMLATKSEDSSKFDDLMNDLEMDFYIKFDPGNNNYSFLSKVLSDWWLRWHLPSRIRR